MSSTRIITLECGIASEIAPMLIQRGFAYDRKQRTFRRPVGACVQIIHFQVGTRFMDGFFSVNLGIYHPIYREDPSSGAPKIPEECHCLVRERLSALRDTTLTRLFRPRFARVDNFLKWWLTTPADVWWKFSENYGETAESVLSVLHLLQSKGVAWLDEKSSEAVLRQIHEEQQRRMGKS